MTPDTCSIPRCRREAAITYLDRGVCDRHWTKLAGDPETLRRRLKLPPPRSLAGIAIGWLASRLALAAAFMVGCCSPTMTDRPECQPGAPCDPTHPWRAEADSLLGPGIFRAYDQPSNTYR